jgi:integrase-like protein
LTAETAPVFQTSNGRRLTRENARWALEPARAEACLEWVGFHTFRHTCATMLFGHGRNAVQVQHWLGHHSAAFTLATYVHLMDGDIGEPLSLLGCEQGCEPEPHHHTTSVEGDPPPPRQISGVTTPQHTPAESF